MLVSLKFDATADDLERFKNIFNKIDSADPLEKNTARSLYGQVLGHLARLEVNLTKSSVTDKQIMGSKVDELQKEYSSLKYYLDSMKMLIENKSKTGTISSRPLQALEDKMQKIEKKFEITAAIMSSSKMAERKFKHEGNKFGAQLGSQNRHNILRRK